MIASPEILFRAWTEGFERWFAAPGTALMNGKVNSAFFFEVHFQGAWHLHYGRYLRPDRAIGT